MPVKKGPKKPRKDSYGNRTKKTSNIVKKAMKKSITKSETARSLRDSWDPVTKKQAKKTKKTIKKTAKKVAKSYVKAKSASELRQAAVALRTRKKTKRKVK